MQSTGGLSLNHDFASSLGLRSPKIPPILHWRNSIRVDPYAHPQHIKVHKHFAYMIWMWDAVIGGLVGLTTDETARIPTKNPF